METAVCRAMAIMLLEQDPRAPRPNLFSDEQNMFIRVVLVCTVNVYTYVGRTANSKVPGTTGT